MLYQRKVKDYKKKRNIQNIIISEFATFTRQWSPQSNFRYIINFKKLCPFLRAPELCICCKRTFTDIPVLCFTNGTQSHCNMCSNVPASFLQKEGVPNQTHT